MALNPRRGFGLLYDSARHQDKPRGKTVVWRVCCELRLNLPARHALIAVLEQALLQMRALGAPPAVVEQQAMGLSQLLNETASLLLEQGRSSLPLDL